MPPRKSTAPKPRGPPRTPPELRSLKASISFRADQKAALERLKADHRLSLLCQKAVDLEADMLDLPDGLRDDALEAAACFQPGDVRCLKAIMGIMRAATGPETDSEELDCLRRLQEAASLLEAEDVNP